MKLQPLIPIVLALALTVSACDSGGGTAVDGGTTDAVTDQAAQDAWIFPDTQPTDTPADDVAQDQTAQDTAVDVTEVVVDTGMDTGLPDTGVDTGVDVAPDLPDTADTQQPPATPMGTLTVNCDVPYVLDASQAGEMMYLALHFDHLIQQWGITGVIGGVDITSYPEKMYYGAHEPSDPVLSLMQLSMPESLLAEYTVRIDFVPDSAVTAGSTWPVGLEENQAVAVLIKHISETDLCLFSIGNAGSLTFPTASGVTQVEGGSFTVNGTVEMVVPGDLPEVCSVFASIGLPCCN